MENEIKHSWKQGFIRALQSFTCLNERGHQFLEQLAEDEWQAMIAEKQEQL